MWTHGHGLETDLILNTPVYPGSVGEQLPRQRRGVMSLLERALPGRPTLQGWYDKEGSGKVAMALKQKNRCALGSRVFGVRGPGPNTGLLSLLGSSHSSGTPARPHPALPSAHQPLLTGKDDHVHAPEDAHDPAHHNDGREHLN